MTTVATPPEQTRYGATRATVVAKTLGLVLFLSAFTFFLLSFFVGTYELDEAAVREATGEAAYTDALASDPALQQSYSHVFTFIDALDAGFERANTAVRERYAVGDAQLEQLVARGVSDGTYTPAVAEEVLAGEAEADSYRRRTVQEYTAWLEGRSFASDEEATAKVREAVGNYNGGVVEKRGLDRYQKKSLKLSLARAANRGWVRYHKLEAFVLTYVLGVLGALLYILPELRETPPGIQHNGIFHRALTNVGWLGILVGTFFILFYIVLYFYPEYMTNWIMPVDPLSQALSGGVAGQFFVYGFIYTLCIIVMGVRMMIKYRHSRYHIVRTLSVMFFQTALAFLIPEILVRLNQPYYDFKNIWPLNYSFFFEYNLNKLIESGALGLFMLVWGIALILVAVPVLVYFFGKRWYCSWVCGCGALAETLGDPYRQLSDKSLKAWQVERYLVHGVLAFAVLMTVGVLYTYFTGSSTVLGLNTYQVREVYGLWIGAGFAGVVGTGFYPFMGNRVWCRFGCPLAAYLGIMQRFKSRFRITTNGGQCISCGNCSTYCEMGIDVRWYAQRGQNIVRASCVGCGVCSSVCPRGVLNLENLREEGRLNTNPVLIGHEHAPRQEGV